MKTMTAIELIADTLRTGIVECGDFNCYDCPFGADREIHLCHSWQDEDARREGLKQMLFDAVDEAREGKQMTERWKPKICEKYWVLDPSVDGGVTEFFYWEGDGFDMDQYNFGNCFRTEEETKAAAEKVKALLLSLHEPEDGNSQKTPISESLQQEDCKKRTFVRPSHTTPEHYKLTPEPIDVIRGWNLGFCLGNVIKYLARAGHKAGESRESDLHKAMEYLRMELEDQANEVYEAYKKKNAVNRQRIEEGY